MTDVDGFVRLHIVFLFPELTGGMDLNDPGGLDETWQMSTVFPDFNSFS
jgi:hypothetical protein